jgi:hypothetical protein
MSLKPDPYMVRVSLPAVMLMPILLASVGAAVLPKIRVRVPVEPEYVELTTGVPDTVRLVEVSVFHTDVLPPVTVMLPVPNAIVRTFELLDVKYEHVNVKVLRESVPLVSVNVPVNVGLPARSRVMSDLFTVHVEVAAVDATVTTAAVPLLASNVTVSAVVGADAPDAPPDVAAQLAVELLFQVPDPPTQNLAAISSEPVIVAEGEHVDSRFQLDRN